MEWPASTSMPLRITGVAEAVDVLLSVEAAVTGVVVEDDEDDDRTSLDAAEGDGDLPFTLGDEELWLLLLLLPGERLTTEEGLLDGLLPPSVDLLLS